MTDRYKTIKNPTEASFFKEKGSKFYGYAFPILEKGEVKLLLAQLKQEHPTAGHFCYAWQLGHETPDVKVNDDGEPKNTAGATLHGQIRSYGLTNVLVVSVRYFGGTKLGVGGLKQAYKHSAHITLESATIIEKTIDITYQLSFDYAIINQVMRIIKEKKIKILRQELGVNCVYHIAVRKREKEAIMNRFDGLYKVVIKEIEPS